MATKPRTSSPRLKTAPDAIPLPSAKLPVADLIDVGTRFNAEALITHAQSTVSNISAPGFAQYGFGPSWVSGMNSAIDEIEVMSADVATGRENALPSGERLDASVANAKEWRRVAITAIAIIPGGVAKGHASATGSSVTALCATITKLAPAVKQAPQTPYGTGAETAATGVAIVKELKAAQKEHQLTLVKLTPKERALHRVKGVLYEELKRVARVARHVVPAESADFAVATHVRSHRRGHRAKPSAAGASATPSQGSATSG